MFCMSSSSEDSDFFRFDDTDEENDESMSSASVKEDLKQLSE